jgi:hypothetical protein
MKAARSQIIAFASMAAAVACLPEANAQNKGELAIESYRCKDLLRESGTERDVAVAFLHGYILGRAGAQKFDVDTLRKQTAAFIERCLDNPQGRALDTMLQSAGAPDQGRDVPRSP